MTKKCKSCGKELIQSYRFCPDCGASVPMVKNCINCGFELEASMKFCPECGTNQAASKVEAKKRLQGKSSASLKDKSSVTVGKDLECDFSTIQEALDFVEEGGKVFVKPGLYNENLKFSKSVKLIGSEESIEEKSSAELPIVVMDSNNTCEIGIPLEINGIVFTNDGNIKFSSVSDEAVIPVKMQKTDIEAGFGEDDFRSVLWVHADAKINNIAVIKADYHGITFNEGAAEFNDSFVSKVRGIGVYCAGTATTKMKKVWSANCYYACFAVTEESNPYLEACYCKASPSVGIGISDNATGTYDSCIFGASKKGVGVWDNANPSFIECAIVKNLGCGLDIFRDAKGTYKNLEVYENEECGIIVRGNTEPRIIDCKIHDNKGEGKKLPGVRISDDANPVFQNCEIYNHDSDGILREDTATGYYEDCVFHDNEGRGFRVQKGTYINLKNCTGYGNIWIDDGEERRSTKEIYEKTDVSVEFEDECSDYDDSDFESLIEDDDEETEMEPKMLTIKFSTVDDDVSELQERVENFTDLAEFYFDEDECKGEIRVRASIIDMEECFHGLNCLKSIELPEGLSGAIVAECENLEYISFPDSFKKVPEQVCMGCTSLKKVKFGKHLDIGWRAFAACFSLESVELPDSVKSIQSNAFFYCVSLEKVKLPSDIEYIGKNVFEDCGDLSSDGVIAPDSVDVDSILEGNEFGDENYSDVSSDYYDEDEFEIEDGILRKYKGNDKNIKIPDSVTEIGDSAFYYCSSLTSVSIPNSVTEIGEKAFFGCSSLTSISIPDSVTEIGEYAFCDCSSLTSISIPNSVTSIGESAFACCSSLTSISIPNSVTSIGDSAFDGCSSLTSVSIPDSVTEIGDSAFYGCSSLTSVSIPDSVTEIGEFAFDGCLSLTSVSIPDSVTEIGDSAFYGCSSLTSVSIPDSVTKIGVSAFKDCDNLSSDGVIAPDSVDVDSILEGNEFSDEKYSDGSSDYYDEDEFEIEDGILRMYKGNDKNIKIPDSVTEIGGGAFYDCSSLTSVSIPNSVTKIGVSAFEDCLSLTSVSIPDSVTEIGDNAFYGCSSLTSVSIPDSVTEIGEEAFRRCSSLTRVSIPNSVTSIGEYAFCECSSLTSISIPNSVTEIGGSAFCACSSLTSISIPNSVTEIGGSAFCDCSSLTSISIPNSVTSIGDCAFYGCSSLTSVSIPDSVTEIGEYAFNHCKINNLEYKNLLKIRNGLALSDDESEVLYCANSSLTSVSIPNSVTEIRERAFYDCSSLTSVSIPNSVTEIGDCAFYGCSSLTSVSIPDSVREIGMSPFEGCPLLFYGNE